MLVVQFVPVVLEVYVLVYQRARPQVGLGPLALRVGGSVVPNSDLLLIWIGCLAECLVVCLNVWLFVWIFVCLAGWLEIAQGSGTAGWWVGCI